MDVLTHWQKKPLSVTLWDPRKKRSNGEFTFLGSVSAKIAAAAKSAGPAAVEFYGASRAAKIAKTTIVTDVEVFPEDNFMTLREKIYLATGVPVYRQHIYDPADFWTPYNVWTDKKNEINIADALEGTLIKGLHVDQRLYAARAQLRVEARDTFTLVGKRASRRYYVVDLNTFVTPVHSQLQDAISDRYLNDLIYWGFIVKYWPTLTQDAFTVYILEETSMTATYPDMAPAPRDLQTRFRYERDIIVRKYTAAVRARAALGMNFAITQFVAAIVSVSVKLNVRNIFDQTRVTEKIPEIRAWVTVGSDRIMVQRQHISAPAIEFPSLETFRRGITFAITLRREPTPQYLWLSIHPNGKYYMRSTFREEDNMNFCDIYDMLRANVRPIINTINEMGRVAFAIGSRIEPLKTDKLIYQGLNIAMFWRQIVTPAGFKAVRESLEEYITAGIVAPKSTSAVDRIDAVFRKGIYEYDSEQIDRVLSVAADVDNRNQYAYMSNPSIHAKWIVNYGGRSLTIAQRDTDIRIDIVDVREDEFAIFRDYIAVHFWTLGNDKKFAATLQRSEYGTDRRLRRLREQDPSLYNLSRLGSDRNYSKICQGVRQPSIYDRREIENLPAKERANLTKYWNFTKDEPAWYGCPDKVHSHIGFIIGVHPAGWCMPCCNKRPREGDAQKACLERRELDTSAAGSRHVMVYGKEIPPERLSFAHPDVAAIFGRTQVYLEGTTTQTNVSEYNIIFAVARVMGVTIDSLSQRLARALTEQMYDTVIDLCAGFSRGAVIAQILSAPSTSRLDWREIQTRLIYSLFNVGIILFNDTSDSVIVHVPQIVLDARPAKIIYVMQTPRGFVYPIIIADNVEYSRDGTASARIFDAAAAPAPALLATATPPSDKFDLAAAQALVGDDVKITRKYVNLRNLCYAVAFSTRLGSVYITIDYSSHRPDGVPVETRGVDIAAEPLPAKAAEALLKLAELEIRDKMRPRDAAYTIWNLKNGLQVYVTDSADGAAGDAQVRICDYDPVQINAAILAREAPPPTRANEEFYKQSIYNVILMTLSEMFDRERDQEMRDTILRVASTGDIDSLSALTPIDLFIIRTTLKFSGMKGLRQILTGAFDFDRVTLRKIQSVQRGEAVKIVQDLLSGAIIEGDPSFDRDFPNMYTSCRINAEQPFCRGTKLVVRGLQDYIGVIVDDLRNPLLVNVIFSELWVNTIIDELRFTSNPDDKVTVYKL